MVHRACLSPRALLTRPLARRWISRQRWQRWVSRISFMWRWRSASWPPDAELIILADNDLKLPKEAHEAAVAVGGRVVVPELDGRKCDFWDVWNELGVEAVRTRHSERKRPGKG